MVNENTDENFSQPSSQAPGVLPHLMLPGLMIFRYTSLEPLQINRILLSEKVYLIFQTGYAQCNSFKILLKISSYLPHIRHDIEDKTCL